MCDDRRIVRNADQVHHERQYGTLKHPVGSADTTLRQVHFFIQEPYAPYFGQYEDQERQPDLDCYRR